METLQYAIIEGKKIVVHPSVCNEWTILHRLGDLWVIHSSYKHGSRVEMKLCRVHPVNVHSGMLDVLETLPTRDNFHRVERTMVELAMLASGKVSPWYAAKCAGASKGAMSLVRDEIVMDSTIVSEKLGIPFTVALEVVFSLIGAN